MLNASAFAAPPTINGVAVTAWDGSAITNWNGVSGSASLTISRQQNVSAQTTSASISTPTAGDLIIVMAHRDGSTTPPTKVTGYTTIDNTTGASTNSAILAFKFSDGTETTTGTWTNATSVTCLIYRNAGLGGWAKTRTAGTTSPMTYGTLTMQNTSGSSWVAGFGATKASTDVGTNAPSGMTTRTSATDIAAFDTGAGVASWSAQTAAVNGTPGGTISYTLEILAIPNSGAGTLFTFIQLSTVLGASGTTAAVTLGQSVGSEPHILIVATQYTANPVEVVSMDKGGTLVPIVGTSGGGQENNGGSYGYAINSTTATTPITVTFAGTTGGADVGIWEIAYTGATPSLDCVGRTTVVSGTTVNGPAFTISGGSDLVLHSLTTDHAGVSINNPYNAPTGYSTFPSGNGWAAAFNGTSATTPAWTVNTTGRSSFSGVAFGTSPTAFTTNMFVDFEGSTNGTSVTAALLAAGMKGWAPGLWTTGGTGAVMKFATAASQPLLNSIARLNDGTSAASGAGSLGVQFLTSTTYSFISIDTAPSGSNAVNSNSFSVGIWFYSDYPNSSNVAMDVFTIGPPGGTGLCNAKFLGNGSIRFFQLEVAGGGGNTSVTVSPSTWYWITMQYNRSASHVLKIYASDGTTLIGTMTEAQTGTGMPGYIHIGQSSSSSAPTTGYLINFDSLKVDPNGAFPLLP